MRGSLPPEGGFPRVDPLPPVARLKQGAHRSQGRRLRPWVLLHLEYRARPCILDDDGTGYHDPGLDRPGEREAPFIEAATTEQANSRLKKEIQQIVESISFD